MSDVEIPRDHEVVVTLRFTASTCKVDQARAAGQRLIDQANVRAHGGITGKVEVAMADFIEFAPVIELPTTPLEYRSAPDEVVVPLPATDPDWHPSRQKPARIVEWGSWYDPLHPDFEGWTELVPAARATNRDLVFRDETGVLREAKVRSVLTGGEGRGWTLLTGSGALVVNEHLVAVRCVSRPRAIDTRP